MKNVGLSFLAGCLFLTGCVVVDERGGPPPPRQPERGVCTMNYDPVCGETRRGRQTYGNACEAGQDRARIVYPGECRSERRDWRDRRDRREERPRRDEYACPQIYQPVCANLNGQTRTFGNACSAGQQGAQVIYDGECQSGRDDRQRRRPDPTNQDFEIRPM